MKTTDYISIFKNIKEDDSVKELIIRFIHLMFNDNDINIKDLHFKKQDLADYYNVDISTLKNWIKIFVEDESLKKILLKSNKSVSYNDFIKLVEYIGYTDLDWWLPSSEENIINNIDYIIPYNLREEFDNEKTIYNKLVNNKKVHYFEYKAYSKSDIIKLLDDNTSLKHLSIDIQNTLNITPLEINSINIIPPKQSYIIFIKLLGYETVVNSKAIFSLPEKSYPNTYKSTKSKGKKIKKVLLDSGFFKNEYEFNQLFGNYLSTGNDIA